MGWATSTSKVVARYGVRYGPHVVAAWKLAGPKVEAAARAKLDEVGARRTAFDHAGTVAEGSVLRVVDRGRGVYVVLTRDEPVAAYPEGERALADLVARADLDQRVTPAQHREHQFRNRLKRARSNDESQDDTPAVEQ